jgi:hypothetical protein
LTAQENFYFYCSNLASQKGIDATRSWRLAASDRIDSDHPTRFLWRKGRLVKEFLSFIAWKII